MDPFATLGLRRHYDLDREELERAYRELQRTLHPDRHVGAAASHRRLALGKAVEVNQAYRTLRDDLLRAEALLALLSEGALSSEGAALPEQAADPELLMEVMELRESLNEAKHEKDLAAVRRIAEQVERTQSTARAELAAVFSELLVAPSPEGLLRARSLVSRLKYHKRLLDEVSVIEEEALA